MYQATTGSELPTASWTRTPWVQTSSSLRHCKRTHDLASSMLWRGGWDSRSRAGRLAAAALAGALRYFRSRLPNGCWAVGVPRTLCKASYAFLHFPFGPLNAGSGRTGNLLPAPLGWKLWVLSFWLSGGLVISVLLFTVFASPTGPSASHVSARLR